MTVSVRAFSVRGSSHDQSGLPCQDASAAWTSEDGKMQILAVADGHSQASCFRSGTGASLACETALKTLKEFAANLAARAEMQEALMDPEQKEDLVHYAANLIIRRWRKAVMDHCRDFSYTEAELALDPQASRHPLHAYGTTLMAILLTEDRLVCIKQGDGRLFLLRKDGSLEQPVPWDPSCMENITTSMCEADAEERIRTAVVSRKEVPVLAAILCSDGIEDAYEDTWMPAEGEHMSLGGTKNFIRSFLTYLEEEPDPQKARELLSRFSAAGFRSGRGSGDDVSIAIIQNEAIPENLKEQFGLQDRIYELEEQKKGIERSLNGKRRKREYLPAEVSRLSREEDRLKQEISTAKTGIRQCVQTQHDIQLQLDQAENTFSQAVQTAETIQGFLKPMLGSRNLCSSLQVLVMQMLEQADGILDDMLQEKAALEDRLKLNQEEKKNMEQKIRSDQTSLDAIRQKKTEVEEERRKTEAIFQNAEKEIRKADREAGRLRKKLTSLKRKEAISRLAEKERKEEQEEAKAAENISESEGKLSEPEFRPEMEVEPESSRPASENRENRDEDGQEGRKEQLKQDQELPDQVSLSASPSGSDRAANFPERLPKRNTRVLVCQTAIRK